MVMKGVKLRPRADGRANGRVGVMILIRAWHSDMWRIVWKRPCVDSLFIFII